MQTIRSIRVTGILCAFLPVFALQAQGFDPAVAGEVNGVRAQLARSNLTLRQYSWTEHTEVLVDRKLQSFTDFACHYDSSGAIVKTVIVPAVDKGRADGSSNRPAVRAKAELQDYIERAVRMIANYVPPKPEMLDALLLRGLASMGQSARGKFEIRFKEYFQEGDSMTFTYDPVTKVLLHVTVLSTLGSPKDPVRLDAVFETLPDGANHMASATVAARSKKIEVKRQNLAYQKTN